MAALFFLVPFLLFWWLTPFLAHETLGNDYQMFAIQQQMRMMLSLKQGSFPLFVPAFATGFPAVAVSQAQIYLPLPYLAAALPGYWSGYALEWVTLLRLFSLGAVHFLLFLLLRRLRLTGAMAFLLSLVTVYNLRMLDLFRYGAAFESWIGFLLLCAALGWYCLEPGRWRHRLFVAGATYWIICSGHPQMMYYGLIGALAFGLACPYVFAVVLPERSAAWRPVTKLWLEALGWMVVGGVAASAFVVPFYLDYLVTNTRPCSVDYAAADIWRDTLAGTLANFVQPLRSDVHGAFGGSPLFLVAALAPLLALCRVRVPRVVWVLWGIALLAFLHMQGGRTPVHYLVWKYLPLANPMRVAGRSSMILVPALLLILVWLARQEDRCVVWGRRWLPAATPLAVAAAAALGVALLYAVLMATAGLASTAFCPAELRRVPAWLEGAAWGLGVLALIFVVVAGVEPEPCPRLATLLGMVSLGLLALVLRYGTWVEPKHPTPTPAQTMQEARPGNFPPLVGHNWSPVVERQATLAYVEPVLAQVYPEAIPAKDLDDAYEKMATGRTARQVVLEGLTERARPAVAPPAGSGAPDTVRLVHSSFNRIVFDVDAGAGGYVGLAYPYTGLWNATVDGAPAPVLRANGGANGVPVPPGASRVEFRYWSTAAFYGTLLSAVTLAGVGMALVLTARRRPRRLAVGALLALAGPGLFWAWERSLYAGDDLGVVYAWQAAPVPAVPNLAYSRRTRMSSAFSVAELYLHQVASGRGVDGDCAAGTGFMTLEQPNPWWVVDLYEPQEVGALVLYESRRGANVNRRPLVVEFSDDGRDWLPVARIADPPDSDRNEPLCLLLPVPRRTRYVQVRASGTCVLTLDEGEVYPRAPVAQSRQ